MPAYNGYEVILIFGTLISLLFVAAIVVFAQLYQNRMLRHKHEMQQQEELKKLQLIQAQAAGQETENRRVALELHDGLAQDIASIKFRLAMLKEDFAEKDMDSTELNELSHLLKDVLDNVRVISHTLLPENIQKQGLKIALQEWLQLVRKGSKLNIVFDAHPDWPRFEADRELIIFRMIQELVQNTLKHAGATELHIQLQPSSDEWVISIRDNGKGFDNSDAKVQSGIGMQTLQQRASMAKAGFQLKSNPGSGTAATIQLVE